MSSSKPILEYNADNPNLDEIQRFADAAGRFVKSVAEFIQPALEDAAKAMNILYSTIYDIYEQDGAIYGHNHSGMMRWLEEKAAIARLRREADEIEERQERHRH